jgi:hypothetical protein
MNQQNHIYLSAREISSCDTLKKRAELMSYQNTSVIILKTENEGERK